MRLVIKNFGHRLSFEQGMLIIKNKTQKFYQEYPLLQIDSITIQKNARLSSKLLLQCIENSIPVFLEESLKIKGIIWSSKFGSIGTIRKNQALLSYSIKKYKLINKLLYLKNNNRIKFLNKVTVNSNIATISKKINTFNFNFKKKCKNDALLRGWEGKCSALYFECYNLLLPKQWKSKKRETKNANFALNILLNYGYGFLYNEITISLIEAGLDPYLGIFHRDQYAKPNLTFDLIEPYRCWVEEVVLNFVKKHPVSSENIIKNRHIKAPYKEAFTTDMLTFLTQQVILWNKRKKTRKVHIKLDCHALAQYILKLSRDELLSSIRY